jgi:hypothetical protein
MEHLGFAALRDELERRFPHVDIELHEGGQPHYRLIIAVE